MKSAVRCDQITPFIVMEILEKIQKMEARGIDVIHMEVGEPNFNVPECVDTVCREAFPENQTHYTHGLGNIRLRETISRYHRKTYQTHIDPFHILVTSGTSPAMLLLFSVLVNPGDEIIISDPHYACYANFIYYCQGIPVTIPVYESEGFVYTPAAIEEMVTERTRAIFTNSPSNPTGNVIPKKRMAQIVEIAAKYNLYIISDEIYHGLVYEGKEHSIFEFTDQAFVLNGFSKLFAMTRLRLGCAATIYKSAADFTTEFFYLRQFCGPAGWGRLGQPL